MCTHKYNTFVFPSQSFSIKIPALLRVIFVNFFLNSEGFFVLAVFPDQSANILFRGFLYPQYK